MTVLAPLLMTREKSVSSQPATCTESADEIGRSTTVTSKQKLQWAAPFGELWVAGQGRQASASLAADDGLNVDAGQGMHAVEPAAPTYVPGAQLSHAAAAGSLEEVPGGHCEQLPAAGDEV
jgi:hypothetical protein